LLLGYRWLYTEKQSDQGDEYQLQILHLSVSYFKSHFLLFKFHYLKLKN